MAVIQWMDLMHDFFIHPTRGRNSSSAFFRNLAESRPPSRNSGIYGGINGSKGGGRGRGEDGRGWREGRRERKKIF